MSGSKFSITTPEGVTFTIPLAGVAIRCCATIIDLLFISVCNGILMSVVGATAVFSTDLVGFLAIIVQFVLGTGYSLFTEWRFSGQTWGKRLLGIRVMDARGLPLRFHQVVVRNIVRPVDMLPLFYLVGGISCAVSRNNQRIGDLAAGTIVVMARHEHDSPLSGIQFSRYNSLLAAPHVMSHLRQAVPAELAAVCLESLSRVRELEPQARLALFAELAERLKTTASISREAIEDIPDETMVANVVQALYVSRLIRGSR
jgi:uncharacterized RDD family membrane protein YckC